MALYIDMYRNTCIRASDLLFIVAYGLKVAVRDFLLKRINKKVKGNVKMYKLNQ